MGVQNKDWTVNSSGNIKYTGENSSKSLAEFHVWLRDQDMSEKFFEKVKIRKHLIDTLKKL